jgi:hypothetical protein
MSDWHLGITAIGRQAVISKRSKRDPRLAIGNPQNVHQEFIQAVIDFCDDGTSVQEITPGGVKLYEIEVRKVDTAPKATGAL